MKSILQDNRECFICHTTQNLDVHHCIHGTANRRLADKWGLTIYLCRIHHNQVHEDNALDTQIKKMAQLGFELKYGHQKWMEVFGKNYR